MVVQFFAVLQELYQFLQQEHNYRYLFLQFFLHRHYHLFVKYQCLYRQLIFLQAEMLLFFHLQFFLLLLQGQQVVVLVVLELLLFHFLSEEVLLPFFLQVFFRRPIILYNPHPLYQLLQLHHLLWQLSLLLYQCTKAFHPHILQLPLLLYLFPLLPIHHRL